MKKHFCIIEITKKKVKLVEDFNENYEEAEEMCQAMNNFRTTKTEVQFCIRCLDQKEFDIIQKYIKTNHKKDISKIYSPYLSTIKIINKKKQS